MSAAEFREMMRGPVGALISAILGSLLFAIVARRWAKWIPVKVGKKGRQRLLEEQRTPLRIGKALAVGEMSFVVFLYQSGRFDDHDWRGAGIAFGLAAVFPVACILAANASGGLEGIKEGMVALAISERTPAPVIFVLLAILTVAGIFSAASLLLGR